MSWFTQNQSDYTFIPMTSPPPTYYGAPYLPQGSLVLTEDVEAPPAYEEHVKYHGGYFETGENYEAGDYKAGMVEFGEDNNTHCLGRLSFCGICLINLCLFCCVFVIVAIVMGIKMK